MKGRYSKPEAEQKDLEKKEESITITMGGDTVTITPAIVRMIQTLSEENWAGAKDVIAFMDVIASELGIWGEYRPSEEGMHKASLLIADIKFFLSDVIGDERYEQFQ